MSDSLYEYLEQIGIDEDRLRNAMDSNEPWGNMVHAFEFVTVISTVLAHWPGGYKRE